MNLAEFKQKYPYYKDVDDLTLASRLHEKYYSNVPFTQFREAIGFTPENDQLSVGHKQTFGIPDIMQSTHDEAENVTQPYKAKTELTEAEQQDFQGRMDALAARNAESAKVSSWLSPGHNVRPQDKILTPSHEEVPVEKLVLESNIRNAKTSGDRLRAQLELNNYNHTKNLEAFGEAVPQLTAGSVMWAPSKVIGLSVAATKRLLGSTPEEASEWREAAEGFVAGLGGLVPEAKSKEAIQILETVGNAIEKPLSYVRKAGREFVSRAPQMSPIPEAPWVSYEPVKPISIEDMEKEAPNLVALIDFVSELLAFKYGHKGVKLVKKGMKSFNEKLKTLKTNKAMDAVAEELLTDIEKEIKKEYGGIKPTDEEVEAGIQNYTKGMGSEAIGPEGPEPIMPVEPKPKGPEPKGGPGAEEAGAKVEEAGPKEGLEGGEQGGIRLREPEKDRVEAEAGTQEIKASVIKTKAGEKGEGIIEVGPSGEARAAEVKPEVKTEKVEPTPKASDIKTETKGKQKTVKVDMGKKEANQLTPTQQKKYLVAEIDEALKTAKEGKELKEVTDDGEYIYEDPGTVKFEIPGDGEFNIINTKDALNAFKKQTSTITATAKLRPPTATTKPSGKRLKGFEGEYYNPFQVRKQADVVNPKKPTEGNGLNYYDGEYFSNGSYIIKTDKPKGIKNLETEKTPDFSEPLTLKKESPVELVAEFYETQYEREKSGRAYDYNIGGAVGVHALTETGREMVLNADYVDAILTKYPNARPYAHPTDISAVVFKEGDKVVGAVMPFAEGSFKMDLKFQREAMNQRIKEAEAGAKRKPAGKTSKSIIEQNLGKKAVTKKTDIEQIADEKRISSIVKAMSKAFDVPIRVGKFRQKAIGIYKWREQVIRVRSANDIGTIVHENGHHLQRALGYGRNHRFPEEVKKLAYAGADSVNREGFAEFVRKYVTDPEEVRGLKFYKEFEKRLRDRQDISDMLIKAREAVQEYKAAPSVAKVMSFIESGEGQKGKRITLAEMYTEIKDTFHPLKKLVQEAEKTGGKLMASKDPYIIATDLSGWTRKAEQFIRYQPFVKDPSAYGGIRFVGEPLVDILYQVEKAGERPLLDAYLLAVQGVHDPKVARGFRSVLSLDDFKQTVKELEPKFKGVAEKLYKYNDMLLNELVEAGRISADLAKTLRENNRVYSPLYRLIESEGMTTGLSKKANQVFNPIKRRKGSSRVVISPTENILKNTYTIMNVAERTRLGRSLIELSKREGMGKYIEKIPFPITPQKISKSDFMNLLNRYGEIERVTDIKTTETKTTNALKNVAKLPSAKMEKVALEALQNRGWTEAEAKQIIDRIKGAKPEQAQSIIENTVEKTVIMQIREELGFGNMPEEVIYTFRPNIKTGPNEAIFFKDGKPQLYELSPDIHKALTSITDSDMGLMIKLMSYPAKWLRAGATTFSPEFGIRNPLKDQMTAFLQTKYGYVPGYDFLRGMFDIIGQTKNWQRFNASGAAHSAIVSMDRNYIAKNLKEVFRNKKAKGLTANPLEFVQKLSELTEEASRVSEFRRALKKEGGDINALYQAAFAGKEVTLNFSRKGGQRVKAINLISAFWNAKLEGADKMVRTFIDMPVKTSVKAFMGITLPSIMIWNAQKDDPDYQEIPAWRKALFWNFVIHRDGKKPFILSLPKPFEYGIIFGSIPEAALDWLYRDDPQVFRESMSQLEETLNVLPIPTGAEWLVEWWSNKSLFYDTPIVTRGTEDLDPELQFGPSTSETVKLVANAMSKVPWVKKYASPDKMENTIRSLTASAGRTVLQGMDWVLDKSGVIDVPDQPAWDISDYPGIKAVVARTRPSHSASIERFYNDYNKLKREFESDKERMGIRGEGIEGTGFSAVFENETITYNLLAMLRKTATDIYESDADPEEKRKELDFVYFCMVNTARMYYGLERIEMDTEQ